MSYKLLFDERTGKPRGVRRLLDKADIPLAEGNSDFREFLEWNRTQPTPLDLEAVDQPTVDAYLAQETLQAQRVQEIIDNLPSWKQVSNYVDKIGNLAEAKGFLKKLARVVYWLAKNTGV
jgi:hypothetical protein